MQNLEAVGVLLQAYWLGCVLLSSKPNQTIRVVGAVACSIAVFAQFIMEQYRWQLIPLYALTLFFWLHAFKEQKQGTSHNRSGWLRKAGVITLFVLYLGVMAALPAFLPVFSFAKPNGPYAVGTTAYHWTDERRKETLTGQPADDRELMVQVWYPANKKAAKDRSGTPYVPDSDEISSYVSHKYHTPSMLLSYLKEIRTNAVPEAAVASAESRYPTVLLSHGMPGMSFTNTSQAEALASHGYIVVGIQHTGFAPVTVLPDGRVVPAAAKQPSVLDLAGWDRTISIWVQDQRFVMDKLEQLNRQDPKGLLTAKIDMSRLAILGHSFGGAAAVQTMAADTRVKAGINMDGTPFGQDLPSGLKQPYLQFQAKDKKQSQKQPPTDKQLAQLGITRAAYEKFAENVPKRTQHLLQNGAYLVTITGAKHMSFSDYYLWSPLLRWMDAPVLEPNRAEQIINDYTVAFFDKTLKGRESPLLDGGKHVYEEVSVEKKGTS